MRPAQFLGLIARANAERALLDAGRKRGPITARDIREIHSSIVRGLDSLDESFSASRGALRGGNGGLDRVVGLVNGLQNDRRIGPVSRSGAAENCAKIISELSRVGVFSSFNVEVGLVLAQRYAKSNDLSVRFSEIEPDDLQASVADARSGRYAGLTRLISGAITHCAVHRAEQGGYSASPGEVKQIRMPADIGSRLASMALQVDPVATAAVTGPKLGA